MDQSTFNHKPSSVTRTLVALVAVFVLLHLAGTNDLLSNLTRPVVIGLVKLLGVAAQDAGQELILGRLRVPWTRDCAGVNILTMLWAITLWSNRADPFTFRYWVRIIAAAPAALLANIARIFTLLAYRYLLFPAVETPQLHYFIGFLWLIPCLPFFVPRGGRSPSCYLLETLYLVVGLSLVSPFVSAPGGNLVAASLLLLLAQAKYTPKGALLPGLVWITSAIFIAAASMESFWIPWLLLCPWFCEPKQVRSPLRLLLVLGTIPLVSMHSMGQWLIAGAVLLEIRSLVLSKSAIAETSEIIGDVLSWKAHAASAGLCIMLVFPFIASSATGLLRPSVRPPSGVMWRLVAVNTYEVRLIGQPGDIHLMWYGPSGDGRHHTLPVCMRYRGIELKPVVNEKAVMTDGNMWMYEFFIHQDELLLDYRTYLTRTFWPWSPAGVHLITSASTKSIGAKEFARQSLLLVKELHSLTGG